MGESSASKAHIQKSLAVWKPELERYTGLVPFYDIVSFTAATAITGYQNSSVSFCNTAPPFD